MALTPIDWGFGLNHVSIVHFNLIHHKLVGRNYVSTEYSGINIYAI